MKTFGIHVKNVKNHLIEKISCKCMLNLLMKTFGICV